MSSRHVCHPRVTSAPREVWRDPITNSTLGEWIEVAGFVTAILVMVRVIAWVAFLAQ